jgi:DNA repair protein RadD
VAQYTLRPYQEDAIQQLRDNIRAGCRAQILCIPTGGGKTLCAAHLIGEAYGKGKRSVMVADRTVLVRQTSAVLHEHGIDHGIIMADHPSWAPWKRVQVASAQTLARRQNWPEADLVLVDEGHVQQATVLRKIDEIRRSTKRDAVVIALTATPTTKGLGRHYERVVTVTTTHKLIAQGFLTPYKIFAATEPDMNGVKVVNGEWEKREATRRVMPIVGDVVTEYLTRANGRKAIGFCVSVAHAREIQRQMMSAGIVAELFTYKEGDEQRVGIMDEFRKPDSYIRCLLSVSALSRGLDVPDVSCVILARPLRSSVAELIQSVGRGLRPFPGKEDCIILDHGGSTVRLWDRFMDIYDNGVRELDDGRHKEKAPSKKAEREPMKCSRCAAVHKPSPLCPACGYEYPARRATVEHEPGTLSEVGGYQTAEGRRDLHAQLLWIAKDKHYADGWVSWKYKAKTGQWPPHAKPEPQPPTPELLRWCRSQLIRHARGKGKKVRSVA